MMLDRAQAQAAPIPQAALRAPETVLRLERMGSFHQTRLSFLRVLLRRIAREGWQVVRTRWEIDARGVGTAVYEARTGSGRTCSLVAFGHDLPPEKRTDRVIAEAWDATFALHDGQVSAADVERLRRNIPFQEAGRCSAAELVMARANRSVRLFDGVVAALAAGRQPAAAALDAVGYLMRTTAVYGGGKFGLADRARVAGRPEFAGPFAAEMLTVWLIRAFTAHLVEHMAACRAPEAAVRLDPALRRRLGVGNSTGLGMAPFVVNHPGLFHRWMAARETALARVRAVERAEPPEISIFRDRLARGRRQVAGWRTDDAAQARRIAEPGRDLDRLAASVETTDLFAPFPWERLWAFAERELGCEAQEFLVTLLLEPYGALVDDLAEDMAGDEGPDFAIDGAMSLSELREAIERVYGFALQTDFAAPEAQARFWYVSAEKLEPRLGERGAEAGMEREQPLGVARDVARLHAALAARPAGMTVAVLLAAEPAFRHAVRRIQLAVRLPYAEIRDNLLGATMRPVDILRCKLSRFGATDFDPRSDRWVRIALFRHAPFPDELVELDPDDWAIPPLEEPPLPQTAGQTPSKSRPLPVQAEAPTGFSLSEVEAEIRKAARGAGFSWGLAEEAGWAGRRLARAAPNLLEALAEELDAVEAGRSSARMEWDGKALRLPRNGPPLSPLVLGPSLSDWAPLLAAAPLEFAGPCGNPALLAPWLCEAAHRLDRQLLLWGKTGAVEISPDGAEAAMRLAGFDARDGFQVRLSGKLLHWETPLPPARPIRLPDALWRRFGRLAARTYVEASDLSRRQGAGAGLSDND